MEEEAAAAEAERIRLEEEAAAAEALAADEAAAAEATAAEAMAAEEAVAAEAAAAEEAAAVEPAAEEATGMAALLTPEGFDADKVAQMINDSDLSAVQKTVLTGAVDSVKNNPALLEATLTRLKEALGM